MKTRPSVRSQPFQVPPELNYRLNCNVCDATLTNTSPAYVVHVDTHKNDKHEIKSASYVACCTDCKDELFKTLTVLHALTGVAES